MGTHPHQTMAAVLHQLSNPAPGEPEPDPQIIELAQSLNDQLLARCPIEEKQKKLQSVSSKLDHYRKLLSKAQDHLQEAQQKVLDLQEERKNHTSLISELENEHIQLVGVVQSHLEKSTMRNPRKPPRGQTAGEEPEGVSSGGEADSEASDGSVRPPTSKRACSRTPRQKAPMPPRPHHIWDVNPAALDHNDFITLWKLMEEERLKRTDIDMKEVDTGSTFGDLSGGSASLL